MIRPLQAAYFLAKDVSLMIRADRVAWLTGESSDAVRGYLRDYLGEVPWDTGPCLELYLLVRSIAPMRVVETGVNRGASTSAFLRALDHNQMGKLISIDLPTINAKGRVNSDGILDGAHVKFGMTGCEVPQYLRRRWDLRIGDSRDILPELGQFDLFFHDSDHSYRHQIWEYREALLHLTDKGVLASDDIDWTPAWAETTTEMRRMTWPWWFPKRGAGVRVRGS